MTEQNEKLTADDLKELLENFLAQGATLSDIPNLSEETMEAIYSIAYTLYNQGKYEDAEKVFRSLSFYDHMNKRYFMGLGACRQMLKRYDEAIETYSYATMLDIDDPRPPLFAGDCHLALGNLEAAKSGYTAAQEWAGKKEENSQIRERAKNMLELLEKNLEEKGGKTT